MTPSQFGTLLELRDKRNVEADKTAWHRTASMMAFFATMNTTKSFTADDFDPYKLAEKEAKTKQLQSPEALINFIAELNRAFGGVDKRGERKEVKKLDA